MKWSYKQANTFEVRRTEGLSVRKSLPDRVPVIVERAPRSTCKPLEKSKFLVPVEMTVGGFYYLIRRKLTLRPEDALFFFVNNTIPQTTMTMEQLHRLHHEEDQFVYLAFTNESVYGGDDGNQSNQPKNLYTTAPDFLEGERLLKKHPDRIPVIVQKATHSKLPQLAKKKFLVPLDLIVGQFLSKIRNNINLRPEEALFFFIGNTIPATMTTMGQLYKEHQAQDKFLYITYSEESVYGGREEKEEDKQEEEDLKKILKNFPFRKTKTLSLLEKHPEKVPVIVEKAATSRLPCLPKRKYLASADSTVAQFIMQIRQRINIRPEEALFFFVGNTIPATMSTMRELHQEHMNNEDFFLYLTYSEESVYGGDSKFIEDQVQFKTQFGLKERRFQADKMLLTNPRWIPVIVEKAEGSTLPSLYKRKFLVPAESTVAQFIFHIRKRIELRPSQGLFFFIGDTLPATMTTMGAQYQEHMEEDCFMYVTYYEENVYGVEDAGKPFEDVFNFEKRLDKAQEQLPILVDKAPRSKPFNHPSRPIYAPKDPLLEKLLLEVRKKVKFNPQAAFFFLINNPTPPNRTSMLYTEHKEDDKLLYLTYEEGSVYGGEGSTKKALKLSKRHPGTVPVIVEKTANSKLESLSSKIFMVPEDSTVAQFLVNFRKGIELRPEESLSFLIGNTIPSMMSTMREVYQKHKNDEDLFLHIRYSEESVYGGEGPTLMKKALWLRVKHPEAVPVIVEKAANSKLASLSVKMFVMPEDSTVAEVLVKIRNKINLRPEQALFFFVGNTIPSMMSTMRELYQEHKSNEDLFLHMTYSEESVYGSDDKQHLIKTNPFNQVYTLQERIVKAEEVLYSHPGNIPIIIEKAVHSRLPSLPSCQCFVPAIMLVGKFLMQIRMKIQLRPEQTVFFFVNNTIPSNMVTMGCLYREHKAEDKFLYITYCEESVYGA